jgi:hypothetical protein
VQQEVVVLVELVVVLVVKVDPVISLSKNFTNKEQICY